MVMGVVTKPHAVVPDGLTVVCFSCGGRVIGYCSYYCSKHLTYVRELVKYPVVGVVGGCSYT